ARADLCGVAGGRVPPRLRTGPAAPAGSAILLGTLDDLRRAAPRLGLAGSLGPDAFLLKTVRSANSRYLVIAGGNDRGVLYGAFALLRKIATGDSIDNLDEQQTPYAPVRWVNHWDNLNGSIERGYGGRSTFSQAPPVP